MKRKYNGLNRLKYHIFPALLSLLSLGLSAQEKITGVVTGIGGIPLEGVTIAKSRSNIGTMTNPDGSFTVSAKRGDVLLISSIGYETQTITVGNQTNFKIALRTSLNNLEEVLVLGYTAQKVKEITASVATVKAEDLVAVPAGNVEQMLQGRVAGLNIITWGMPGASSRVRLHGIGNFGNVTPLYIIDGVEGDINGLNPYDIESLQVLKDAGAYSIFGVRGANGVIVVTTRKGKTGKTKINYNAFVGTARPLKKGLELLTPQENADLYWLAFKNSRRVDPVTGNPSHLLYGNGPKPILPDYLFAGPYQGLFAGDPRVDSALHNIDESSGPLYQIVPFNKTGTDWFHTMFKPQKVNYLLRFTNYPESTLVTQ